MGVIKDLWDYVQNEMKRSEESNPILYYELWKETHPQYIKTPRSIQEKDNTERRKSRCFE